MPSIQAFADDYLQRVRVVLDSIGAADLQSVADVITEAYQNNRTIFVVGNGGSASTASHMGCDLNKATAMPGRAYPRVLSLTDNIAWFSALANDIGYESVFVEQLRHLFRPGDILIAISASGNSPNLLRAMEYVNANEGRTIAFVGFTGGAMKKIAHASVHVEGSDYGPVEDGHLILNHLFTEFLRAHLRSLP
jgi:D-sedoheptulose 7-phosphate isomerase